MRAQGNSMQDRYGKAVLRIRLLGDDLGRYTAPRGCSMVCEQSFHGDHDEVWIVARTAEDVEVNRWNIRAVAEIVWVV